MEVWIFFFSAHICGYLWSLSNLCDTCTTYNTPRDAHNKTLKDLTELVVSLAAGFKDLSKTVVSALESVPSGASGRSDPVYKYSKNLPGLNHADYGDLPYWHKAPWSEIRNGSKVIDKGDDPILVLFFEDETGTIVPKSEIQCVRNFTRAYFELLWTHNRAPPNWGGAPLDLQIDFVRNMEEEFDWLRYCHRHWKAEQIFMNYYPTWYGGKTKKNKKASKRARPDDADNNDNEDGDDNDNPGGSKRPRLEETETSSPTPALAQPAPTTARKRVCLYI
jgi:hypothetical protein